MKQMDDQTFESPRVGSIIDICDDLDYVWNSVCTREDNSWSCDVGSGEEFRVYIEQVGKANVTVSESSIRIHSILECVHIMVWLIPW